MNIRKILVPFLLITILFNFACVYIVLPEGLEEPEAAESENVGWTGIVTNVSTSDAGDLRIEITIRNDTGDWSAMNAEDGEPALLSTGNEKVDCETVFVGTGGHRLAPGFQMRGYISGTKAEPQTQLIYVECAGAQISDGSTLSIDYIYVTGQYNYYEQDANQAEGTMELNLDEVVPDVIYPIGETIEGLIQPSTVELPALNKLSLTLLNTERTDTGLIFTWQTTNPSEYPSYVHIGIPPVIGSDGILYGYYETPDLASVPLTPAGDKAEWTTEVVIPQDVNNLYIMLSVEDGKARLFKNYAVDITGQ